MNQQNKDNKLTFLNRIGNGIDNIIGVFSPYHAGRRKYFRYISRTMLRSYRGADTGRFRAAWGPGGGSADQDLLTDLPKLRERSRDLIRNDGIASGAIDGIITNIMGSGIKPQSRIDKDALKIDEDYAARLRNQIEKIWKRWIPFADAGNRLNFYQIEELEERQRFTNGETIIIPVRKKDSWRPYSLALQSVEADRLATPSDLYGDKSVRSGIKIGKYGEPVKYYIRKTHPGDYNYRSFNSSLENFSVYSPRDKFGNPQILHLYHVKRAGQTRGEPFFAPVINLFKDRFEYMEAELVANRIAACFALFIKKNNAMGAAVARSGRTEDKKRIEDIYPGMLEYLEEGEDIVSFNPNRPGSSFTGFMERILRDIAAGLNIPYEILAKDFSKSNYSNTRAALLEARRFFMEQQTFLASGLCQPSLELLIEEAYLKGELPILDFYQNRKEYVRTRWVPPGWPWIDPQKEVRASTEAVNNNLSTLADEAAARGQDWEENLEQRARELKKIKDLEEEHGIKMSGEKDTNTNTKDDSKIVDRVKEEIAADNGK